MHPLNKLFFGNTTGSGALQVKFNNGSSVVTGWIVSQPSWTKFNVTSDGVNIFTCNFITTSTTPQVGEFTIIATPFGGGTEHVQRIDGHHVFTFEGNKYIWVTSVTAVAGDATLAHY